MNKKTLATFVWLGLAVIIGLPLVMPYFHPGYFPTHDGESVVIRLGDMIRTLRDGQFPVRWSGYLNHGYGYPLFNFAYPFPYYLGALVHLVTRLGLVDTVKLVFASSVPLSSAAMFWLTKKVWKSNLAALLSAVLYAYFPYRIVNLYVRGSFGESVAFVIFPLLVLAVLNACEGKRRILGMAGAATLLAVLIATHNIAAVEFLPIIGVLLASVLISSGAAAALSVVSGAVLGLGLSAFFFIPALFEKGMILLSKIPIADRGLYFVSPRQLVESRWGYGSPIFADGFSYQFSWPHLAVFTLVLVVSLYSLWKFKLKSLNQILPPAFGLVALFYFFLLFSPADFIWRNTPLLREINYPWTLLEPLGFIVTFLAPTLWTFKWGKISLVVLTVAALGLVLPQATPRKYVDRGDQYYLTNDGTTTSSNEFMPLWVKTLPTDRPARKVELVSGAGSVNSTVFNSKLVSFSGNFSSDSKVRINQIYYPGWEVAVDGKRSVVTYENQWGVIELAVPAGRHTVVAKFSETVVRKAADAVSLVSIAILVSLGVFVSIEITGRKVAQEGVSAG